MKEQIKKQIKEKASLISADGKIAYKLLMKFSIRQELQAGTKEEQQIWMAIRRLLREHYVGFSKEAFLKALDIL